MLRNFLNFFYERPLISKLILVLLYILSIVSYNKIKKLIYPLVDFNRVEVITYYPGASAKDIELNITNKIENKIKNIEGIKKYTSQSLENNSKVVLTLDPDYPHIEKIKNAIRRAITSISDFPSDLQERPIVKEINVNSFYLYEVALVMEKNFHFDHIKDHLKKIKKKLQRIPGVSQVEIHGGQKKELQIRLNPQKMKQFFLSFNDIITAIKKTRLRKTGGSLESFKTKSDVIIISDFKGVEEFKNIILRANYSGKIIKLEDVATVQITYPKKDLIVRYNGHEGASLWIYKSENADIFKVTEHIRKTVDQYKKRISSKKIKILNVLDRSVDTKARLSMVYKNLFLGLILVIVILFLFLPPPMAFWTAIGIPTTMAILFFLMPFFNITINSISLCGIILVLGMVVDDAIIISEMIYKNMLTQKKLLDSTVTSLKAVTRPIFCSILTTIVGFLPLYFLPGLVGKFAYEIPQVVTLALLGSFIEAIILLPLHLLKNMKKSSYKTPVGELLIKNLQAIYKKILIKVLKFRYLFIFVVFLVVGIFSPFLKDNIRFKMFPEEQAQILYIMGEVDKTLPLSQTLHYAKKIEEILLTLPPKSYENFRSIVGVNLSGELLCTYCFYIKLKLPPPVSQSFNVIELKKRIIQEKKKIQLPELKKMIFHVDSGGPNMGRPLEIYIIGNDDKKRMAMMKLTQDELKKWPLHHIETNLFDPTEEIFLIPQYEKMAKFGVYVEDLAHSLRTALEGTIISRMDLLDESIPIRVVVDDQYKNILNPLQDLLVENIKRRKIPIENLVTVERRPEDRLIYHYNGERTYKIAADVDSLKINAQTLYLKLKNNLNNTAKKFHDQVEVLVTGEGKESLNGLKNLMNALLMALLLIYFILSLQFQSLTQPFLILSILPFSVFGLFCIYNISNVLVSYMSLVGVLGFSGVIINDSILLVDCINSLKKTTKKPHKNLLLDLIIDGAMARFRPIFLTTFTTVVGLMPAAYGLWGSADIFVSPMVFTMTWGLLWGTFCVIFLIPPFYAVIHDFLKLTSR